MPPPPPNPPTVRTARKDAPHEYPAQRSSVSLFMRCKETQFAALGFKCAVCVPLGLLLQANQGRIDTGLALANGFFSPLRTVLEDPPPPRPEVTSQPPALNHQPLGVLYIH